MRRNVLRWVVPTVLAAATIAHSADAEKKTNYDIGGRISPQILVTAYPENSLFHELVGSWSADSALDARVLFRLRHQRWSFDADYQFIALYGDRVEYTRDFPEELQLLFGRLPNDERRLFDLTYVFNDAGKTAVLNRLDRLSVKYTSEKVVAAFGRQAITWGNGLIYTTMDIFNPFDPAAVDREFKTGDDMLYSQVLLNNGHDVQGVAVFRRSLETGDVEADVGSLAFKYHGLAGMGEFDALVARHYGDTLLGAGGNHGIGGSVWRGDLVVTVGDDDTTASLVTSMSHSWIWGGKNVSGVAEYFHNGFGQSDGCYEPDCLAENPDLLERLARGELFTLGRDYLAMSAMIEVTPLFQLTPNLFTNLGDPSALLQIATQNDLREDLLLWCALNVPVGADGTEFGGIPSGIDGIYLSNDLSALVQLVWYW
jgi:hypothetical protein